MKKTKRTKGDRAFLFKLGVHLRNIRNSKGWSLEYTEEKGWRDWKYLQKIETGKKDIGTLMLKKLSRLYHIKISDIFKEF